MRVLCVQEMESSTSVSKMAAGVAVQMQLLPAEMQQKTLLLLICRHRVSTSQIIGEKIYERKQAQPASQPARPVRAGSRFLRRLDLHIIVYFVFSSLTRWVSKGDEGTPAVLPGFVHPE